MSLGKCMLIGVGALVAITGGGLLFKKLHYVRYKGEETLEGKTVIITGANSGIGKETALEFARRGGKIIMACRDLELCDKAREDIVSKTDNEEVHCWLCDLANMQSIRAFAEKFCREETRLNIVVNNAGIMRCPKTTTADGFEMHLGTNHLGHFVLTNLLVEKMKQQCNTGTPSRIINVSSYSHKRTELNFDDLNSEESYNPKQAYDQSKLANMLFTQELAKRLQDTQITANAVNPGLCYTHLGRHLLSQRNAFTRAICFPFLTLFKKTARQGAQTTIYCALCPDLANVSGKYFSNCREVEPSSQALDAEAALKLWLISEEWTSPNRRTCY